MHHTYRHLLIALLSSVLLACNKNEDDTQYASSDPQKYGLTNEEEIKHLLSVSSSELGSTNKDETQHGLPVSFSESESVAEKAVSTWYQEYLSRSPDPSGLKYNIEKLLSGASCEETANQLLSPLSFQGEGRKKFTNQEFITRVYKAFLQRDIDQAAYQNALSFLKEGGSRYDWFQVISHSSEFQALDVCQIPYVPTKNNKLQENVYQCLPLLEAKNNENIDVSEILKDCIISANGRWVDIPAGKYWLKTQFVEPKGVSHIALKTKGRSILDKPCSTNDPHCAQFISHKDKSPENIWGNPIDNTNFYFTLNQSKEKTLSMDHLIFDGNKDARDWDISFAPDNRASLIKIDHLTGGKISNSVFKNTHSGTAMEVKNKTKGLDIDNNIFINNGYNNQLYKWSDGLTIHALDYGHIRRNIFINNTDIQLVFGGGNDTIVEDNVFMHSKDQSGASFAEVMFHTWPEQNDGDFYDTYFRNNVIDCGINLLCGLGIYVGGDLWYDNSDAKYLTIENNTIKNAPSAVYLDEGINISVRNNKLDNVNGRVVGTSSGPRIMRPYVTSTNSYEELHLEHQGSSWKARFDRPIGTSIPNAVSIGQCMKTTCEAVNIYEYVLARTPSNEEINSLENHLKRYSARFLIKEFLKSDEFKKKFNISSSNTIEQVQFLIDYLLLDRSTKIYSNDALSLYPDYGELVDFLVDLNEVRLATEKLFPHF